MVFNRRPLCATAAVTAAWPKTQAALLAPASPFCRVTVTTKKPSVKVPLQGLLLLQDKTTFHLTEKRILSRTSNMTSEEDSQCDDYNSNWDCSVDWCPRLSRSAAAHNNGTQQGSVWTSRESDRTISFPHGVYLRNLWAFTCEGKDAPVFQTTQTWRLLKSGWRCTCVQTLFQSESTKKKTASCTNAFQNPND